MPCDKAISKQMQQKNSDYSRIYFLMNILILQMPEIDLNTFKNIFSRSDDDSLDLEDFSRSSRRLSTLHEENEADCVSENSLSSAQPKHKTSIRRAQSAEKTSPKSVPITKLASFSLDRIAKSSSVHSLTGSPVSAKLTATSASRWVKSLFTKAILAKGVVHKPCGHIFGHFLPLLPL